MKQSPASLHTSPPEVWSVPSERPSETDIIQGSVAIRIARPASMVYRFIAVDFYRNIRAGHQRPSHSRRSRPASGVRGMLAR